VTRLLIAVALAAACASCTARDRAPGLPWLHADGGHPGIATTELMAVLLYSGLTGSAPTPGPAVPASRF